MKALKIYFVLLILFASGNLFSQLDARNDNYILRDDVGLDYNLYVKSNDTPFNRVRIYEVNRLGASAGLYIDSIIDSNHILIRSIGAGTFSGQMVYRVKDSFGLFDTAIVSFTRTSIPPSVRPGESNNDNIVNHFDIFSIGLNFEKRGDGRHNLDTNTNFNVPKRITDWTFGVGGINAKYSDIDGNGVINQLDFEKLKPNLGLSSGVYSPRLSDTNSLNNLRFIGSDTVQLEATDSNKIKRALTLSTVGGVGLSHGIGFTMSVSHILPTTGLDTLIWNYNYSRPTNGSIWPNSDPNKVLFLEDKVSKGRHTNIGYSLTTGKNEAIGNGDVGTVVVIVDEILIGKTHESEYSKIRINLSEVAFIDANYNTIPIKPISKYIYFRKAKSSITQAANDNKVNVYPTLIQQMFTIEKLHLKIENFYVYNALGQEIIAGQIRDAKLMVNSSNWSKGMYFLRLENSSETFRLIKE